MARPTFSGRTTHGLGGSPHAGGGLWFDLPLSAFTQREAFTYWNDFLTSFDLRLGSPTALTDNSGGTADNTLADVEATYTEATLANNFADLAAKVNELITQNPGSWTETDVGTQTLDPTTFIRDDVINGVLRIDSDATDGDGIHLQLTGGAPGEIFLPAASDINSDPRIIAVEFRLTHEDWDAHHWFVGLGETSATFMDAAGDIAAVEHVGFHHNDDDDADGIPRLVHAGAAGGQVTTAPTNRDGSSKTLTAGTDDTFRRFGLRIVGTTHIEWYIDGEKVGGTDITTAANALSAQMCISIASVMNTTVGDALDIDYIAAAATR